MFLDPDPRRQNLGSSPFFSSQTPIVSPRERRESLQKTKRKPLHERTPSQNNQQRRAKLVRISSHAKQTVRLVGKSPGPSRRSSEKSRKSSDRSRKSIDRSDRRRRHDNDENSIDLARREQTANEAEVAQPRLSLSLEQKPASASKPGFLAASGVSESESSPGRDQLLDLPQDVSLPSPKTEPAATEQKQFPSWLHRRSNSSTSATLRESEAADTSFTSRLSSDNSRLVRVSDGPTLRDTPPLEELELSKTHDSGNLLPDDPSIQTLASPETSTVRAVLPSSPAASRTDLDRTLRSRASEDSLPQPSRPRSYPTRDVSEQPSFLSRQDSQGSSTGSIPLPSPSRRSFDASTPAPRRQRSRDSLTYSSYSFPVPSSPNFITFTDSSRPFPYGQDSYFSARSYESIQSRLESPVERRPDTARSVASNNTWASRQRSSSVDTVPPLRIARKRVRGHKGSLSASGSEKMDYPNPEEVDTAPWPRAPFSSHLSTIASEGSRSASRQLSHFSLGSGVMTPDYASSIPPSGTWSHHQGESGPMRTSIAESLSQGPPSSGEEPGDMTMGLYRAESAKPEPLFRGRQMSAPDTSTRRYDGPLPPIPPIPADGESSENVDVLSELSAPPLRQKRSGYSIRARSNSTPSGSHSRHQSQVSNSESERWSQGSFLFPIWAKNFYAGNAALLSASKISLSNPPTPRNKEGAAPTHERNGSTWTERSITSRLGTGYSELQGSPTSSSFLPSIFRPRTRTNAEGGMSSKLANKLRRTKSDKSKASRPSQSDSSRPGSIAIFSDPFDPNGNNETLPSGQPKYGALKDQSDVPPVPRLPRKYSKQKQWDNMTFPRPMTKDRISEFHMDDSPHLGPSQRQSNRLSAWRTPSFVESLDTLFNSRGNRQILFFCLGFVFPFFWLLGALLPLPPRPGHDAAEAEKALPNTESEDDLQAALRRHTAGDASKRWTEERMWLKAKWWRTLNRIMCFVGVGVIAAVIALAVVATR